MRDPTPSGVYRRDEGVETCGDKRKGRGSRTQTLRSQRVENLGSVGGLSQTLNREDSYERSVGVGVPHVLEGLFSSQTL